MSDEARFDIVLKLRDISKNILVKSAFGADDPDYQSKQCRSVCEELHAVYITHADAFAAVIDSMAVLIPTVEEIRGIEHMQNIVLSASQCLDILKQPISTSFVSENEKPYVESFLSKVRNQAEQTCKGNSATTDPVQVVDKDWIRELIADECNRLFQDFSNNYKDEIATVANYVVDERKSIETILEKIKNQATAMQTAVNAAKTTAEAAATSAQEATDSAKKAQETADAMLPNMLSVLGILVGIVVAVVGCYLSILLGEHSNDVKTLIGYSRPFEFMRYLFMGHLTAMVVFLLMYLISRISKHTLSCSCNGFNPVTGYKEPDVHDCTKCTNRCSIQSRFARRYPYLFGINMSCCIGYAVLLLWQFINVYFRDQFDAWVTNTGFWGIVGIVGIVGIIVGTIVVIIRSRKPPNNK